MKKFFFSAIAFFLLSSALFSQRTNHWKGGTPGQESNWNCPRNWSLGKVPDAFDRVVIPDVSTAARQFPVIKSEVEPVLSLRVEGHAQLTLTSFGVLQIETNDVDGLHVYGKILNEGIISVNQVPEGFEPNIAGTGKLLMNGELIAIAKH
jgi:hypothetical protein